MYGRPYGKSLCHAWGAGPLYLLARYFAGLRPASPGYKSYIVEPHLAGLGSFRATFPAGKDRVEIAASERDGVLRIEIESGTDGKLILGNGRKTVDLPGGRRHVIEEKA